MSEPAHLLKGNCHLPNISEFLINWSPRPLNPFSNSSLNLVQIFYNLGNEGLWRERSVQGQQPCQGAWCGGRQQEKDDNHPCPFGARRHLAAFQPTVTLAVSLQARRLEVAPFLMEVEEEPVAWLEKQVPSVWEVEEILHFPYSTGEMT